MQWGGWPGQEWWKGDWDERVGWIGGTGGQDGQVAWVGCHSTMKIAGISNLGGVQFNFILESVKPKLRLLHSVPQSEHLPQFTFIAVSGEG